MVLVSLGGEVEFAVGEVVISVASVKTTYSVGWADSSLFETHLAESASFGIAATGLKLESVIALLVQTIDVHRQRVLSVGFVEAAICKLMITIFWMLLFDDQSCFFVFAFLLFQYRLWVLSVILLPRIGKADQVLDQVRKLIQHVENSLFGLLTNHWFYCLPFHLFSTVCDSGGSTFNIDALCQHGLLLDHVFDAAIESLFNGFDILFNLNPYLFLLLFEHF